MPHLDLDAFIEEQVRDPLEIVWVGRTITAPSELPWAALKMAGEIEGVDLKDPKLEEKIRKVVRLCLGEEDTAWLWGENPKGRSVGLVTGLKLVNQLGEYIMQGMPKADGQEAGDEAAPKAEAERPSDSPSRTLTQTLRSSRPTSLGSIRLGEGTSQESGSAAS